MRIQLVVRYPQIVNTAPAFSFHLFSCSLASSSNLVVSPMSLPVSGSEEEEEEMRIPTKSLFRSCHNHPIYWKCHPRAAGWQLEEKENEREKRRQGIEWRRNGYGHCTLDLVWMKEKWEWEFTTGAHQGGLSFLQGEKGKQIASTVLFISPISAPPTLFTISKTLFSWYGLHLLLPVTSLSTHWSKGATASFPHHGPLPFPPTFTPRSTRRPPHSLPPSLHLPASKSGLQRWSLKDWLHGLGIMWP